MKRAGGLDSLPSLPETAFAFLERCADWEGEGETHTRARLVTRGGGRQPIPVGQ